MHLIPKNKPNKKLKSYIQNKLSFLDEHTLEVLQKSAGATVVKIFGILAGFVVSVGMGSSLGAEGLGVINLATRIACIVLVVCMFGMDSVLVKNISIGYGNKDNKYISKHLYAAFRFNVPIALFLALLGIVMSPFLSNEVFKEPLLKWPLIIAFAVLIPQTISRIYATGLTGFRKIWQSNLVNETLSAAIVAAVLITLVLIDYPLDVVKIAIVFGFSRVVVAFTVGSYWHKIYKGPLTKNFT